jgi:hypothetical protein
MTVRFPRQRLDLGFTLLFYLVPLLLAVLVGCSVNRPLNVSVAPESVVDKPWLNVGEASPSRNGEVESVAGLSQVLAGKPPTLLPGRPLNILVMSGGGKYGAFTAGALAGWTQSGNRPVFDVATGISSGAVTAAMAYLGPKYDERLGVYFTTLQRSDLFKFDLIHGLKSGRGLMTSEPLEKILERELTEELMADMRAAHESGRRLYIGTGNILTNRFTVWDLGAIACSGRPDATYLVRKILLASCSPPGLVMPVEFNVTVNGVCYREWHADAGNFAQAFVRSPIGIPAGTNFWVLSAGKNYRDEVQKKPTIFGLTGAGISNSLYSLFRADALNVYALCAVTHSNFRLLALPQEFHAETSSAAFDPQELKRMYWEGYNLAMQGGEVWAATPPDTLPHEATPARTGFDFVTP